MIVRLASALFVVTALSAAASAQQSTIVIGESAAASCYQNALHRRGDQLALRACNSALESGRINRTDRRKTYVNRAVIYLQMNRPQQALSDLDAATRLRFDVPEMHLNYSAAYIRLGRNQEAIASATQAIEDGFHLPQQAYFNRAIAYENAGDLSAAFADFTRASELAPDWAAPRRELERFAVNSSS